MHWTVQWSKTNLQENQWRVLKGERTVHNPSGLSARARVQLIFLQFRGSGRDFRSLSCNC